MPRTVLLTGFEPFEQEPINPSWEAVRALDGARIGDAVVVARQLPCVFGKAIDAMAGLVASLQPDVVIADESVSALDLSIQKQVLRLLDSLQRDYRMAIIFITHDLRVAAQISDYITVMEKGVMVEFGPAEEVFANPKHPYTKKLLDAAPGRDWHPPRLSEQEAARIAASIERM